MSTVGLEVTFEQIIAVVGTVVSVPLTALGIGFGWAKNQFDECSRGRAASLEAEKKRESEYNADKLQMSLEIRELQTEQRVYKEFHPEKIAESVAKALIKHQDSLTKEKAKH